MSPEPQFAYATPISTHPTTAPPEDVIDTLEQRVGSLLTERDNLLAENHRLNKLLMERNERINSVSVRIVDATSTTRAY